MGERRFKKACRCYSSASGPRFLIREKKPYPSPMRDLKSTVEVVVVWADIACDECDTPWEEVAATKEEGR